MIAELALAAAFAAPQTLPGVSVAAFAAPQTSPGVSVAATIPERGVISARAVGHHLYVSSLTGVSVFDVSVPRAPVRVGRLELPNAQNEDVDVGSGLLLVSDDPAGGRGILHVIDVRDPANPRPLSQYRTWPRSRGIGHTATCIQRCRYAWLAGSPRGIEVVDLRDPAHPRRAGRFGAREAAGPYGTHDVQVDGAGLASVAGSNGTAAYDVSNPVRPRLVRRTDRRGSRPPLNDLIHHNSLRLGRGVVAITEEAFGRSGCRGAGTLQTWRIPRRGRMTPLDSWGVERDPSARLICSAHYFDARDGLIAQGFYEQGVRLIDARRPGRLRQVGYYVARPGLFWGALFAPTDPTGSTVYALDHSRGIDVLALDRAALRPVRRSGARPVGPVKPGWGLFLGDEHEAVRPGQRLAIGVGVFGPGRQVDVRVTLPPELVRVRPPRGASFDPATRTLGMRLRGGGGQFIRARVARSARRGSLLETIGYVSGPEDPFPLDDRGVDLTTVARRGRAATVSAVTARRRVGFCRLP